MPEPTALDLLDGQVERLRAAFKDVDPVILASRTGSAYHSLGALAGELHLSLWERPIVVPFPELRAREAESGSDLITHLQALLLYYFTTCDGSPESGQWISFSELPDGRIYNQAFQRYTGRALALAFQNDLDAFARAAESVGGKRVYLLGDLAFAYRVLPLVSILVVYWQGDEEMQPACQILFDSAVSHHLPTDACAVIGSTLKGRLIKQKNVENLENY